MLNALRPQEEKEGSVDISVAGLFRCMCCTHAKTNTEQVQLMQISDQLRDLDGKLKHLEL